MEPFHDFVSVLQTFCLKTAYHSQSCLSVCISHHQCLCCFLCLPVYLHLTKTLPCCAIPLPSCLPTCKSDGIIVSLLLMAWQQVMSNIWSNTQRESADFAIINSFLPKVREHLIGLCEFEHHMGSTLKRDQMLRPSDHHTAWCLPHDELLKNHRIISYC